VSIISLRAGSTIVASLFQVEVLHQLHRALDVGEQCCDVLALAIKRRAGGNVGDAHRGCRRFFGAWRIGARPVDQLRALKTELCARWILGTTQRRVKGEAHSIQNVAPSGFSKPHFERRIK
jgi:hypothetical protein